MKKYLNFLLIFSLIFSLGFSMLSYKTADAAVHGCTKNTIYDPISGTSCSLIPACTPGEKINFKTGVPCPGATTTSTTNVTNSNTLNLGILKAGLKKNEKVALLQAILNAMGFSLETDGSFGSRTLAAVKAKQKELRIRIDGVVGPATTQALIKELSKTEKGIALLKKIKILPSTSTGGGSGSGTLGGGGGAGGTSGRPATTCTATHGTSGTRAYKAIVNADNYFKVFIWNKNTKVISGAVMQDLGGYGKEPIVPFSEEVGVDMPEAGTFNLSPGDQIVIAQLVDSNSSRSAVMGQFSFEASGQKAFYTNAGNWQVALSRADAPTSLSGFTTNFIKDELSGNLTWANPNEISGNDGEPFSSGIDPNSAWISAFANGAAGNNKKIAIYMTKESGIDAAPSCGSVLGGSCTFPYVGTGNVVNNQVDCKFPPPSSSNIDPGIHVCGPSNLTDVEVTCTGIYPNLTITSTVTFSPGAAAIVPASPPGVELGLAGVPEITLKSTGGTYGTKLKFAWSGVATSPLSTINGATLLPLSVGSSYGFPGGFYRNGLTAFPLNNQAFPAIAAIAAKVECTPPPITPTLEKVCIPTPTYPAYALNATATFPKAVTIVGNPKLVSTPTGLELNPLPPANQPADNKSKTWVNVPPAGLVAPALSYLGSLHEELNFVTDATNYIKYTDTGETVKIADIGINDNSPTGCSYEAPLDGPLTGSCTAPQNWPNITYTLNVKFTGIVNVTGTPQLQILGAPNGLILDYVPGGSGTNTLTFKYIATNPNTHVYADTVGDGQVKFILDGADEIKDGSNTSLNGLIGDPFTFSLPTGPNTISCPRPTAEIVNISQKCTGVYPNGDPKMVDEFSINFSEKVISVTGSPKIKVNKPNGVIATFASLINNGLKARFKYEGVKMDTHDYDDFNGDVTIDMSGTPTPAITSENGTLVATSGGVFTPVHTGTGDQECPIPNPDTLPQLVSIVKSVAGSPTQKLKAVVNFSEPVVITGSLNAIKLEVVSEPTKTFKFDIDNLPTPGVPTSTLYFVYEPTTIPSPIPLVKFATLPANVYITGTTGARVPDLYDHH